MRHGPCEMVNAMWRFQCKVRVKDEYSYSTLRHDICRRNKIPKSVHLTVRPNDGAWYEDSHEVSNRPGFEVRAGEVRHDNRPNAGASSRRGQATCGDKMDEYGGSRDHPTSRGTDRRAATPSRSARATKLAITVRGLIQALGRRPRVTHSCDQLSAELDGSAVVLGGWLFSQRSVMSVTCVAMLTSATCSGEPPQVSTSSRCETRRPPSSSFPETRLTQID